MTINVSSRLLQAFLALAQTRHFTKAAERCHVSQSAFSGTIKRLEDAVGVRLFDRTTRSVTLTPEGELFAEAAQQLEADIEAAFTDLADYVARRKGRVGIAALPSMASGWLPQVIGTYRRQHPPISVELYDTVADRCLDLVRQGKADLALTAAVPSAFEFVVEQLSAESFYLVCRRDHALASAPRVRLAQLAGEPFIHFARTTSVRQHVEAALRQVPVLHSGFEIERLGTAAGLIVHGLGVSVVPELTLFEFRHPELACVPLDAPELTRPILLVRRSGRRLSVAAQALLDLIQSSYTAQHAAPGRA